MSVLSELFGNKAYTLSDLVSLDQGRIDRSGSLGVELVDKYHIVRSESLWEKIKRFFRRNKATINMYYVVLKYKVSSPSGSSYNVFIELNPNFDYSKFFSNPVKVYCQCSDFKYRCAYKLGRIGSLFRNSNIDLDLGQALTDPPSKETTTSPACKHIYASINHLKNNYNNIVKSL